MRQSRINNLKTLATLDTQDTGRRQTKQHYTESKVQHGPHQKSGKNLVAGEGLSMCASYKTVAILLIESTRVGHHYTYICKNKMTSVPNRNIIDLNIFNLIMFYSNGMHTL